MQIVSVSGEPRPESLSFVTYMTVNVLGGPSSPSVASIIKMDDAKHLSLENMDGCVINYDYILQTIIMV